jgi:acetate kinase
MLVLVLNCGSSSLKFAVIDLEHDDKRSKVLLSGLAERLFEAPSCSWVYQGQLVQKNLDQTGYAGALGQVVDILQDSSLHINVVGHRVVHGGDIFKQPTLINDQVLAQIEACVPLAPLHNPANLQGIYAAKEAFRVPQVAVFDTAFHQSMPPKAYRYALPETLYQQGIRRYGFHGSSHQYIARQAAQLLGRTDLCLISAHLGNGCSVAAIKAGESVDTSMGFTPLEGLVMGTRSGDIDPGLHAFLLQQGWTIDQITETLNKKSGLLGLSGLSSDMRELEQAAAQGHAGAQLAIEVFCYRLAKHIAGMGVALGRIDALVFTGGIGENSAYIRAQTLAGLGILGFSLDPSQNALAVRGKPGPITTQNSTLAMVINTNEELMIALQTQAVLLWFTRW